MPFAAEHTVGLSPMPTRAAPRVSPTDAKTSTVPQQLPAQQHDRPWSSLGGSSSSTQHPAHASCLQHGHGSTALGSHQGFTLPAGLDFKTLVCLFVAGQPREDGKKKKNQCHIVTYESLLPAAEMPHSSPKMLGKP